MNLVLLLSWVLVLSREFLLSVAANRDQIHSLRDGSSPPIEFGLAVATLSILFQSRGIQVHGQITTSDMASIKVRDSQTGNHSLERNQTNVLQWHPPNLLLQSYDTGNCLLANYYLFDYDCRIFMGKANQWTQEDASGYPYQGWFQLAITPRSEKLCLQAGSNPGYWAASSGDRVILMPCVGSEPTQIWTVANRWGNYVQFKDLGSGKCLDWDRANRVAVMWDCNYNSNNQWWLFKNDDSVPPVNGGGGHKPPSIDDDNWTNLPTSWSS